MSFNSKRKFNQLSTGSTAMAAGLLSAVNGSPVLVGPLAQGSTLVANISMGVKTTNLVMTPNWQGSDDQTTWDDLRPINNPAYVGTAAGTNTLVTTATALALPAMPLGYLYLRAVVKCSAASADGTNDVATIQYRWVEGEFADG